MCSPGRGAGATGATGVTGHVDEPAVVPVALATSAEICAAIFGRQRGHEMNLEAGRFFAKVKIVAARCGAAILELLKLAGARKGRRPFLFSDKNETNTRLEPSYTKGDGLWSKARIPANWSAKSNRPVSGPDDVWGDCELSLRN